MGGRGTGPRLNKHTPQQDAHDPTQFQQRVYDNAPHPTFGTGGVAMPGIAVQRDGLMKPSALAALSKTKSSGRVSDLPAAVKKYSETYERQTPSPSGTGIRERTISTPSVDRPVTPRQPIDDMMASPFKSPIMVPSLAGPIRPQPRPSASGPQIPPSVTPSKAFLRPPSHKEPTPSLSRLQGRGFVQSMVQVSSQLESPPPSIPETPEQNKPESGRRSSVLDRWQLNVSPSMPSPPVTPTPHSMRRSVTTDSTVMEKSQVSPADPVKKPWEGPISSPSTKRENIPPHPNPSSKSNGSERPTPTGLGSATTLVVYKTKPIDVPALDEFGFKPYGSSRGAKDAVLDLPAPSKPLSHVRQFR
ncbi:hypothetical protein FPV67DRAFT_1779897 [Lyophyllum atratum]|nr:hypothetical protein FPV67DRAFT_1779897 [Lyophyllum atratum]